MNLHNSYFALPSISTIFRKWFNPATHSQTVNYHGKQLLITWTKRAEKALCQRRRPLIIEMQLYFSCVVKKRVLFHDISGQTGIAVNDMINIIFRPVQSTSCDPVEFANNYPIKKELTDAGATNMRPSCLEFDYINGTWCGSFTI